MALWPNNRTDILGRFPVGISAYLAFQEVDQRVGRRLAYFANEVIEETSSIPEGAFQGPASILPPLVAGGMSSSNTGTDITLTGTGNALAGGPMEGATTFTLTGSGGLSLQVTLNGNGAVTVTGSGGLALTIGLASAGSFTVTGAGGLSMIVPFDGLASFALTGSANLKGNLSLAGDVTPFTELSPENLAAAVWNALATQFNEAGTMGAKLNTASSGGVDLDALAAAVWAYATRTLTDTTQPARLLDIWQRLGLDPANPQVTTSTSIEAGGVSQTIAETAGPTITVTRLP